jgi:hypothetical protein
MAITPTIIGNASWATLEYAKYAATAMLKSGTKSGAKRNARKARFIVSIAPTGGSTFL